MVSGFLHTLTHTTKKCKNLSCYWNFYFSVLLFLQCTFYHSSDFLGAPQRIVLGHAILSPLFLGRLFFYLPIAFISIYPIITIR